MTFARFTLGVFLIGLLGQTEIAPRIFTSTPAQAGEVCYPNIRDYDRKVLRHAIYSHQNEPVSLNCHHFKIRIRTIFVVRERQYRVSVFLTHVQALRLDNTQASWAYVSERGDTLRQEAIGDTPDLKTPVDVISNSDWKPYAAKLIKEVGKLVQADVQTLAKKCPGGRDHREGAVVKCHLRNVVIDTRKS